MRPNRIDRNIDARYVVYIDCSNLLPSFSWSTRNCNTTGIGKGRVRAVR